MECFIGTILPWAGAWVPRGWALCDGSQLPIAQNQALFAVIGTTYGGDGKNNFNLPNLCGRVAIGDGQLSTEPIRYKQGAYSGTTTTTLQMSNLPAHMHSLTSTPQNPTIAIQGSASVQIQASTDTTIAGAAVPPNNGYLGPASAGKTAVSLYANNLDSTKSANLNGGTVNFTANQVTGSTGSNTATAPASFSNMPPYQVVKYIICLQGLWPDRD
ncbi:hypothetical protein GTO91_07495 [Heliobacterium undosum]|uniref:Phage tail collar domain-containing protein n=1 Tax=Heliomicrobium undosum TaxID=121734 RepID=A0A845L736_9FIRM|nr:tail fiber protein [Heliomicrobium undosum]MZP29548.1 hypothetical protein [Heliomicrobium undosum]